MASDSGSSAFSFSFDVLNLIRSYCYRRCHHPNLEEVNFSRSKSLDIDTLIKVRDYLSGFFMNIISSIHSRDVKKLSQQSKGDYVFATSRKYPHQYTHNIQLHTGYNYTAHLGEEKISQVK